MPSHRTAPTALAAAAIVLALAGCSAGADAASGAARPAGPVIRTSAPPPTGGPPTARTTPTALPGTTPTATRTASLPSAPRSAPPTTAVTTGPATTPPPHHTGRTSPGLLTIPGIGVADLRVVPYEGTTDDRPGTRIQDRGLAASPYGKRGGVGPGQVGNYLITAHRLSAGGPLHDLPSLGLGDRVLVTAGGTVYEYRITATRKTSFRSARSLAAQRAAVPGRPGVEPTRAMITLSTCATPEDNAAGNRWRDARGNPEHRIDKIGVLVSTKPAPHD
ncbi:class E sortase [Streptomyces sp. NPDC093225]|uniref:class E sortase n=1 Tax=Streptomyces sp. NPDC093225 TaxID=3366034 RepID=UPI0037F4F052